METPQDSTAGRWSRGVAVMERIRGEGAAAIRDGFERRFPDLGRYVVEVGFADVYDRPGSLHAGHPRAGNALRVIREVLAERGIEPDPPDGRGAR